MINIKHECIIGPSNGIYKVNMFYHVLQSGTGMEYTRYTIWFYRLLLWIQLKDIFTLIRAQVQ